MSGYQPLSGSNAIPLPPQSSLTNNHVLDHAALLSQFERGNMQSANIPRRHGNQSANNTTALSDGISQSSSGNALYGRPQHYGSNTLCPSAQSLFQHRNPPSGTDLALDFNSMNVQWSTAAGSHGSKQAAGNRQQNKRRAEETEPPPPPPPPQAKSRVPKC